MKQALFICTGNTCRSPMAEAIFNHRAQSMGLAWRASSAGIMVGGEPLSEGACRALKKMGLELPGHVSRQVTREMLEAADLILCMAQHHAAALQAQYPKARVELLGERDITDPYGSSQNLYDFAAEEIDRSLNRLLQRLRKDA